MRKELKELIRILAHGEERREVLEKIVKGEVKRVLRSFLRKLPWLREKEAGEILPHSFC